MKLGSALLLTGLILLPTYFYLFYSTFKTYADDGKRYVEEFGKDKWRNMIAAALVVAAFVISSPVIAAAFIVTAFIWLVYGTLSQHRRMKELGFGDGFRQRLARISVLSPVALLCLFGSKAWFDDFLL